MNKKKFTLSPYLLKLSVKLLNEIAFIAYFKGIMNFFIFAMLKMMNFL